MLCYIRVFSLSSIGPLLEKVLFLWMLICMSAPLALPSFSVFRGQTCQKAHKAGVVLEECTSPSPPLFFQPRMTFSGNPGRSNILSLGPRHLFPQGEVIDYSATCDACRCACDVARDVSFALIKNKKNKMKKSTEAFSFLLHRRAFLKEAAGSEALLITMKWLLDADRRRIVLYMRKTYSEHPGKKII